jgi:pilus assembly protein CpaE
MQVYFFTAGVESSELSDLEDRIRTQLPNLRKAAKLDEVTRLLSQKGAADDNEQAYIIFPVLASESIERIVNIAEREHPGTFFIFVSKEISASDYKRLVRGGGTDWASLQAAPQEIADIISRTSTRGTQIRPGPDRQVRPAMVALSLASGGSLRHTLRLKPRQISSIRRREAGGLPPDLDLKRSYLRLFDIEPRLQVREIIENPEQLDAQLFDLFVGRHPASGIDVPRSRNPTLGWAGCARCLA